jgi:uncharacterized membrane-anchored protein
MRKAIAVVALVLALGLVNWSILGKEKHLSDGRVVYLRLAPVDPRSLMQGDYMALRFHIANEVFRALPKRDEKSSWRTHVDALDGYAIVTLDKQDIGTFSAVYNGQFLNDNQILMRYRVRDGRVKFATNAFFFQEGHGEIYQAATLGQFRVDKHGELLLSGMYDKNLQELNAASD